MHSINILRPATSSYAENISDGRQKIGEEEEDTTSRGGKQVQFEMGAFRGMP